MSQRPLGGEVMEMGIMRGSMRDGREFCHLLRVKGRKPLKRV